MCRETITIKDPRTEPADATLTAAVADAVSPELLEARAKDAESVLQHLLLEANSKLPVFFMRPGTTVVGRPVALHFFEPRYKILIRRAWEGNRRFIFASDTPREGLDAVVVHVDRAVFLPDGRANILGVAIHRITMGETWVEEGTQGLYHTRVDILALPPSPPLSAQSRVGYLVEDAMLDDGAATVRCQVSCAVM